MRAKNKEAQPLLLRSAPLGKAGLAAGTTHWVLEIPPASHKPKADSNKAKKPLPSPKPMLVHVFVVPDGDRAWIGMGGDDVAIASRLATLATGKAGLDTRPELSSLKTASVGSAGFVTVQALAQASAQLRGLGGGSSSGASESLQDLAQMPQKGMTPIVLSTTATPGALTAQISAPRGAIEDLVGAILRHAGP
jgi:hypothetical protein